MKINCVVRIECPIDVPDYWNDPEYPVDVLHTADYHYNEKLSVNEALNEIERKMTKYFNERNVEFIFDFEGRD